MSTKDVRSGIDQNIGEWHFVWDWWPVPQFLFALLGADGCRAFVDGLNERRVPNRMLVSFALAIEHRRTTVTSKADLDDCLARIFAPEYDFTFAKSFERAVLNAKSTNIDQKARSALERTLLISDTPDALGRAIEAKGLPTGRVENIALMRKLLAGRSNK